MLTWGQCRVMVPMGKIVVVAPESLTDSTTQMPPSRQLPERMHEASRLMHDGKFLYLPPSPLLNEQGLCFQGLCAQITGSRSHSVAPPRANQAPRHLRSCIMRRCRRNHSIPTGKRICSPAPQVLLDNLFNSRWTIAGDSLSLCLPWWGNVCVKSSQEFTVVLSLWLNQIDRFGRPSL